MVFATITKKDSSSINLELFAAYIHTSRLSKNPVTLNKARALYLVRVSELHVKSMYKIDILYMDFTCNTHPDQI